MVIPRLDGDATVEYRLEFNGLPKQCGRCRAHDHLVRNCPKRIPPGNKKENNGSWGADSKGEPVKETCSLNTSSGSNGNKIPPSKRSPEQGILKDCNNPALDNPGSQEKGKSKAIPVGFVAKAIGGLHQTITPGETPNSVSKEMGLAELNFEGSESPEDNTHCWTQVHPDSNCAKSQHTSEGRGERESLKEKKLADTSLGINSIQAGRSPEQIGTQKVYCTPIARKSGMQDQHQQSDLKPVPVRLGDAEGEGAQQMISPRETLCMAPTKIATLSQTENPMLQPDDINFPKLQTPPLTTVNRGASPSPSDNSNTKQTQFVWRSPHITTPASTRQTVEGSKGKEKLPESAPLTRQGYRT